MKERYEMIDERRKQPRKPCSLKVPFSVGKSKDLEPEMLLHGETADVSATGLSLIADHPLEPGEVVSFGNQRLSGTVRWCEKLDHFYRFGVKFN